MVLRRGGIYLANLNPRKGAEVGKVRPVLVIQNQMITDAGSETTLVIPLTTNCIDNAFPLRIRIKAFGKLEQPSDALIGQIRSLDNQRFIDKLGDLEPGMMRAIDEAIHIVTGI